MSAFEPNKMAPVGHAFTQAGSNPTATRSEHNVHIRLAVDRTDPWDVERASFDAIAAANAVLADEVDDPVLVLHDCTGCRAGFQATRILTMHAAILADQPFQIAFIILPLGEAHQRPGAWIQIHGIVIGSLEISNLVSQIVPFHAGGLTCLATDASSDIDQLCHLGLVIADGGGRQGRSRPADVILRLKI